jgi:hypothetical protein
MNMFKKSLIVAVALCGAAPAAWSQATMISYETGIESSTDFLNVPDSASGTWSITPCMGCSMLHLHLDEASEFFVGRVPVSLATLRKYAARDRNHFDVFYETKTLRVTRLILRTQLDPADVPSQQPVKAPKGGSAIESRTKS